MPCGRTWETDRCSASLERGEPAAGAIPGIGVAGATAIAATVPDPTVFRSGRDFAAWIGLVPREDSTGGKPSSVRSRNRGSLFAPHSGGRSRRGIAYARQNPEKYPWLTGLLARKPFKVAAVALANKTARIAWALLAKGGTYRAPVLTATA